MGLSASIVNVTPNELVYLIVNVSTGELDPLGTSVTITANETVSVGAGDLCLDCIKNTWGRAASAKLRRVCRAGLDGLGTVAAGAWTQVLARDLLNGNGASQAGSQLMPRAEIDLQPATGAAGGPVCEALINVGVDGTPVVTITAAAVAGSAILRLRLRSSPGVR